MKRMSFVVGGILGVVMVSCTDSAPERTEPVEAEIAHARTAYLAAWTAGDADAVMAHQTDDIALLPHLGAPPVIGLDNVRDFWFPPNSPPWTVFVFDQSPIHVAHDGSMAYEYGRYTLEYAFEGGDRVVNEGNYLTVWRRQPGGRWLRSAQIWNHS